MLLSLILIPFISAILSFLITNNNLRRLLLVISPIIHFILVLLIYFTQISSGNIPELQGGWISLDPLGFFFLAITSALFMVTSFYAIGYLKKENKGAKKDFESKYLFYNAPEAIFTGCLFLFLGTMTLVTVSQHFGLLWVAVEATTLATAPLIYFHRHHRSLEATWKYLLICSVGIALALLGNFFLAVASIKATPHLIVSDLLNNAEKLNILWLKTAFIFIFVGYGTKMGLAPFHTWLPDAHSESPSLVSALLSGTLLNCAFLAILRMHQIFVAAGIETFSQELFIIFGLLSMFVAAVFIIGQTDYKRMLAYSSIEHMGIISLGVGLGGIGIFGALLHALNHSFTKSMLFLVAGNILSHIKTKSIIDIKGIAKTLPVSGFLWVAGGLAITGSPPFGMFISKFTILKASITNGNWIITSVFLFLLIAIFTGFTQIIFKMSQGHGKNIEAKEDKLSIIPPVILCIVIFILGIMLPDELEKIIKSAQIILEGQK